MNYRFVLALAVLCCTLWACSDANIADIKAMRNGHHVELYSGGVRVRTWESTGMIENEGRSDGYYFMDSATKKLIRISGTVVITVK